MNNRLQAGDFWGGVAATAVVLPQAMAFGVALWAVAGLSASAGALAGLIGAAAISLASGLVGGTRGMISSPTGPMLVIQVAAMGALLNAGLMGSELLTGLMAVLVLSGLFQFLIGVTGGGKLIKFLPYPVVAGFITGSGVLMIFSQYNPLTAVVDDVAWQSWQWLPLATAAVTFGAMQLTPQLSQKIPATVAGLVVGVVFFQVAVAFGAASVPQAWVIGELPKFGDLGSGFQLSDFNALPWPVIVSAALALSLLASVDTLLTSVVADVETRTRHDARRELIGQGIGQLCAGVSGGMAGAGSTGASLVAVRSGGMRWVGAVTGVCMLLLVLVGGSIGQFLPLAVLAGVILHVAMGMLDRDILRWLGKHVTRMDGVIALLVSLVTIFYDLMVAVAVGVVIAAIIYIRHQVIAPVVHRRSNISQRRSVVARTTKERELLNDHAEKIVVYELRGNIFFATADQLFEEITPDLDRNTLLILHLLRVQQIDITALKIFHQMAERLDASGGALMFCELHKELGLGRKMNKALKKVTPIPSNWKVRTFVGSDEALAWAENHLLKRLGASPKKSSHCVDIAETELCEGMTPEEIQLLSDVMITHHVKKHDYLFRFKDVGDELYVVLCGQIDIRLPTTKHHYKRLAVYRPGTTFGEIAFFNPGKRVADAVAMTDVTLVALNRDGLKELNIAAPATTLTLLTSLAKMQGDHLRWSAREIIRLSQ